jgi:hypothetical protein
MNAVVAAACALGTQGFSIFPCRANKRPATPNGFKAAVSDRAAIEMLWRQYPGVLVGVATGAASGIAVLDIDAKHGEARQWWAQHRARLLPARVHRTRSGGLHVVYRQREGLACSVSWIARGVDVRADGGYIIWWPASGLPVLADSGIVPWPEWLAPFAPSPGPLPQPPHSPIPRRAQGIVRTVALAQEGERNRLLFWSTCRAREMLLSGDLDNSAGIQVIEALREAARRAGLAEREIDRTITGAMRAA